MSTSTSKKRGAFWRTDAFVALLVVVAVLVLHQVTDTVGTLERRFYDDVRVVRPDIPERLANVLALSLGKRPESRYQNGEQFAADLRSVLDGPAGAKPGLAPEPATQAGPAFEATMIKAADAAGGYDAPERSRPGASEGFANTSVISRPAPPRGPAVADDQTDLEARSGKL